MTKSIDKLTQQIHQDIGKETAAVLQGNHHHIYCDGCGFYALSFSTKHTKELYLAMDKKIGHKTLCVNCSLQAQRDLTAFTKKHNYKTEPTWGSFK